MREIKLRAWDRENKAMLYSPRLHQDVFTENDPQLYSWSFWGDCILDHGGEKYHIMQYTGLKDKNGKEIYEGDIITHKERHKWPRKVSGMPANKLDKLPLEPFTIEWGIISDMDGDSYLGYPNYDANDIEIVGNIYDNPELMKEGHE